MKNTHRSVRHALIITIPLLTALAASTGQADAAEWTQLESAAHPRSEGTLIEHGGNIFHLNGFNANIGIQNSVERFDIASGDWQTVAETTDAPGFPTALTHNGTVVVGDEAWLIGGRVGGHPGWVTDKVIILDLNTYTWRDGPDLPMPFAGGGAALVDGSIHVFGGLDENAQCDVNTHLVYELDDSAAGWQDLSGSAPFPMPRNHFGTAVMDGLIYAIGGQIGHDNCAKLSTQRMQTPFVHVYDPTSNDWDRLDDLPWSQSHAEPSTFVHAGRIWSVGGLVQGDRVLSYDAADDEWSWRTDLALPMDLLAPGARILNGNRLHVFGGGAPNVFNPRTETWVTVVPDLTENSTQEPVEEVVEEAADGEAYADATPYDTMPVDDVDEAATADVLPPDYTATDDVSNDAQNEAHDTETSKRSGGGATAWLLVMIGLMIRLRVAATRRRLSLYQLLSSSPTCETL